MNRVWWLTLGLVALSGMMAGPLWAAQAGAYSAFPWDEQCQNLRLAHRLLGPWNLASLLALGGLLLLLAGLLAAGLRLARRASDWMLPLRHEAPLLLGLGLLLLLTGRRAIGLGSPNAVEQLLWAVHPPTWRSPLEALLNGWLAYAVRLVAPLAEIPLILHATFALLGLGLVYLIALLIWENRRFALAAVVLAGLSPPFLGSFAVDLHLHLITSTAMGAVAALLLVMYHGSRVGWLALAPLAASAVILSPATLGPLLFCLPAGARHQRPPGAQRAAAALWVAALAVGMLLRLSLFGEPNTVLDPSLLQQGAGLSLVTALAGLVGLALSLRKRHSAPVFVGLAGLSALVLLPIQPSSLVLTGAYAWLGLAFVAPLAARGVWELAAWVTPSRAHWVVLVLLAGTGIPALVGAQKLPSSEIEQVYRFERAMTGELSAQRRVLYLDRERHHSLPPFASFLALNHEPLCLRPREALATDPASGGEPWIYFGPECALEAPRGEPSPRGCRFYRLMYELEDCRGGHLVYTRQDGRTLQGAHLEYCRVRGLRDSPGR